MRTVKKIRREYPITKEKFFNPYFLFLFFVALIIRVISFTINREGFYYSDSWDYVVVPSQPGPSNPLHPPSIYWIWKILCLGYPSELKIIIWQMVFGIVGTCLVYFITMNFINRNLALIAALVFTASPFQIFFEKVLVPEALSTTLFLVCILTALRISRKQKYKALNSMVIVLGTATGCLVILKPSNLVVSVTIALYCALRIYLLQRKRFSWMLLPTFMLLILMFCGPIYALASTYNKSFGSLSLSPVAGTVLSARWSNSVSCEDFYTTNKESLGIINSLCKNPNHDRASLSTFQIYSNNDLTQSMFPSKDFSSVQGGLMENLIGNALRNPASFLLNELTVISEFLFLPVINDLALYAESTTWGSDQIVKNNFANMGNWLERPDFLVWSNYPVEKHILISALDFPRVTLLIVVCLAFIRMLVLTVLKFINIKARDTYSTTFFFLYLLVVVYLLTLTLAAPPLFRYWYLIGALTPIILLIEAKKLYDLFSDLKKKDWDCK